MYLEEGHRPNGNDHVVDAALLPAGSGTAAGGRQVG